MSYKNPMLVEIYSELHFEPGYLTQAGFFDLVPRLREEGFSDTEIGQVVGVTITPAEFDRNVAPRVRCWSTNRDRLVQLSDGLAVINQVGAYPGWKAFRQLFDLVVDALVASIGGLRATSISLVTIDKMRVPKEGFTLGKYLQCGGTIVPAWYKDASVACDLSMGKGVVGQDGFNRQVKIAVRPVAETEMEINTTSAFHNACNGDSIVEELEKLHYESSKTFESLITDDTRSHMGGRIDAGS